jgi:hypothetical protein
MFNNYDQGQRSPQIQVNRELLAAQHPSSLSAAAPHFDRQSLCLHFSSIPGKFLLPPTIACWQVNHIPVASDREAFHIKNFNLIASTF